MWDSNEIYLCKTLVVWVNLLKIVSSRRLGNWFKVALIIHVSHDIPKTRRRDKMLMECFVDCGVYNINKLSVLNQVCKYKEAHLLADALWCKGKTVDPEMLLPKQTDIVSTRQLAIEGQKKKDKVLQQQALYSITSPNLKIQDSITDFLRSSHH